MRLSLNKLRKELTSEVYIIGNGKSLDSIDSNLFSKNIPILCCNESHIKIDSLCLKNMVIGCCIDDVSHSIMTPLSNEIMIPSERYLENSINYYCVETRNDLEYFRGPCFVFIIQTLKRLGVSCFNLIGFDYFTSGSIEYSKVKNPDIINRGSIEMQLRHQIPNVKRAVQGITTLWYNGITYKQNLEVLNA